jgi:hypothetical protein
MNRSSGKLIIASVIMALVFIFSAAFTGRAVEVSADAPLDADGGIAFPLGPIDDRTPDYKFTKISYAVKYRVKVYATSAPTEPIYILKGSGDCESSLLCHLQATTNLKMVDINGNGYYYWTLEAKDPVTGWHMVYSHNEFRVYSTGFVSNFDSMKKWIPVYGTWSIKDLLYLKDKPYPGHYDSIVNKFQFTDGYVFEVTMKRKGLYGDEESYIIVKGQPDLTIENEERWSNGIIFGYNNAGNCRLSYWDNKSVIMINDWEYGCNVHQNDWNTLTVFVNSGMLYAYMNGVQIYKIAHPADSGWVGIGGFEDDDVRDGLLVDSARVYFTDTEPFAAP